MKSSLLGLIQLLFTLYTYAMGVVFFGFACAPGVYIFIRVFEYTADFNLVVRSIILGMVIGLGYFLFGLTLVLLAGMTRWALGLKLKEGSHRILSFEAAKWAFISSLYLLINFTFIYFILLTPFVNILQRLLGAKIGKNVQINSKFVFDASLLEIGDNSVIGGGAVIIGHQVQRGVLRLKKVKIGKNVTIGSNAIIAPGCEIGDNTIIGAGAVLMKNTKIEPRSIWHGVPAKDARKKS